MMEGLTTTASHVEWWSKARRHVSRRCRWCKKEYRQALNKSQQLEEQRNDSSGRL